MGEGGEVEEMRKEKIYGMVGKLPLYGVEASCIDASACFEVKKVGEIMKM